MSTDIGPASTDSRSFQRGNGLVTTQDKILIEARVQNEGPSKGASYLLWGILGLVSAHRFYLGRPWTAILQIVLLPFVVGIIWVLVDAFLIPGMIRSRQQAIRDRLTLEILSAS